VRKPSRGSAVIRPEIQYVVWRLWCHSLPLFATAHQGQLTAVVLVFITVYFLCVQTWTVSRYITHYQ